MNKLLELSKEYANKMNELKEREIRQEVLSTIIETHQELRNHDNHAKAYGELLGKLSVQFHLFEELRKYRIIE